MLPKDPRHRRGRPSPGQYVGQGHCTARADEPETEPVFSPDEIRFNATEDGCDDFRYPPDPRENEQAGQPAGYGCCNTDMMPYDQLVAATMLIIKYHLGDDVVSNQTASTGAAPGVPR